MNRWISRLAAVTAGAAVASFAVAPQASAAPVIQPGVSITMGGSYCTLNWIYDGTGSLAGKVYGGTAAHCVDGVGQSVSMANGTFGDPVLELGKVAYVDNNLDYAFIEIDAGNVLFVNPALKGHPQIPTGVSTTETAQLGDIIQFSGHGVGFHLLPVTQEQRKGVLVFNDGEQHYVDGAVSFGDSGGPVADMTDGNKALGLVNTVGLGVAGLPYVGEGGVSLEGMFTDAASAGFTVALRTVG
jgi:hypothetical protein